MAGDNGNGVILALPKDTPFPNPAQSQQLHPISEEEIKETKALENLMGAIDGDGSPLSYLSASLFAREAGEFGALWHGCWWTDREILFRNPIEKPELTKYWHWHEDPQKEWCPTVTISSSEASVVFYTYGFVARKK